MTVMKSIVCFLFFFAALVGALWPILQAGELNWRFDMDIEGGLQITYRADFSSLSPEQQNALTKRRLMELSHLRLDATMAHFQGVDVRVQILGEDRLLVEVPGVHNIAKVKKKLGEMKVVSFARVVSAARQQDERVERDVTLHAAQAEERKELGEFVDREVAGPGAGVEFADTEVHRVGAVLDGGADGVHVPRRGQDLGTGARGCGRRVARRKGRVHGGILGGFRRAGQGGTSAGR